MKTTIVFLFVALLSVSSYSQETLKEGDPLIGTWVYVGDLEDAPVFLADEKLSRIELVAGENKSTIILGTYYDYNHFQPSDQFIATKSDDGITASSISGSGALTKNEIKTIEIKCVFDPATDALFVTKGDHRLIFMRK
jgi:hypothetical protein